MSNRQERKARKERQRNGEDAFVHTKPTKRAWGPALSRNEIRRRAARFGVTPERKGPAFEYIKNTEDEKPATSSVQ